MGEKGVGKLSRETPPPREGEPMGATSLEEDIKQNSKNQKGGKTKHKRRRAPSARTVVANTVGSNALPLANSAATAAK